MSDLQSLFTQVFGDGQDADDLYDVSEINKALNNVSDLSNPASRRTPESQNPHLPNPPSSSSTREKEAPVTPGFRFNTPYHPHIQGTHICVWGGACNSMVCAQL